LNKNSILKDETRKQIMKKAEKQKPKSHFKKFIGMTLKEMKKKGSKNLNEIKKIISNVRIERRKKR